MIDWDEVSRRGWRHGARGEWWHWSDHPDGRGPTMDATIRRRPIGLARLLFGKYLVTTRMPLPTRTRDARTLDAAFRVADLMLMAANLPWA